MPQDSSAVRASREKPKTVKSHHRHHRNDQNQDASSSVAPAPVATKSPDNEKQTRPRTSSRPRHKRQPQVKVPTKPQSEIQQEIPGSSRFIRREISVIEKVGSRNSTNTDTNVVPSYSRRNTMSVDSRNNAGSDPEPPLWKMLDVELILVIHLTASLITYTAVQDVLLDKACRVELKYSGRICDDLQSPEGGSRYAVENQEIQKLIGSINMWRTILENFLPIILVCQIGAWSDKYGRKVPMLVVMLSFLMQYLVLLGSAYYKEQVGAWSVGLISSLIVSLAGSSACFGMCIFSYVSDVTPEEKLTARTSITGSSFFLGLTLGILLGGQLSRAMFTHTQIFLVSIILELIGIAGLAWLVKERQEQESAWKMLVDLFDMKHFRNAVCSVAKARPGNNRKKLLLLLMCHSMILAPIYGESAVSYLHARNLYKWDTASYSNFVTYKLVMGFIGNFVSMAVLTECLMLSDPTLGIVSGLSQTATSLIFAFSSTTTLAYCAPVVSLFSGSIMVVPRSIMFKVVPNKDTGKVNSCMGSLESLTPLLVAPFYKYVYFATLETFPGAFHLLSAGFMLPPIIVYLWLQFEDNANNNFKRD